jgi:glutathione S-transferase
MKANELILYQSTGSPNSRRVRIFLAEKGICMPMVPVDLGAKEQFSEAYADINPRRVVPTLMLADGTAIGEVPAILRYLEDVYPEPPLYGIQPAERAITTMWERQMELEGFVPVMEAVRNGAASLKQRAIAGPHAYEQIPTLIERGRLRVGNFYQDLDARLASSPFVAGNRFSAADITALVTIDFATKALDLPIPAERGSLRRWYELVSARASMSA